MNKSQGNNADLDSILDDVLDEFEKQETRSASLNSPFATEISRSKAAPPSSSSRGGTDGAYMTMDEEKVRNIEYMERMMAGLESPEYGEVLQNTLKSLSKTEGGNRTVEDLFAQIAGGFHTNNSLNAFPVPEGEESETPQDGVGNGANNHRDIAATLAKLAEAQQGMQGFEASKMEEAGETMMEDMMAEFEALGEKEDYNEVIDGVMKQLLSRDLMVI